MREVKGFLADDGTFHQSKDEAERHEALQIIYQYCDARHINKEAFMYVIEALADPIVDYVHAHRQVQSRLNTPAEDTSGPDRNTSDDIGGGLDTQTME